jgi:hypothetical protein
VGPPSALRYEPHTIDFGEVLANQKKSISTTVVNNSARDINVERIEVSCGCVKGDLPGNLIPAGGQQTLTVTLYATPRQWTGTLGVNLVTDEPGNPWAPLTVKGSIKLEFVVDPMLLNFDTLGKRGKRTATATIRRTDGTPFQIKDISASNKEFAFKWTAMPNTNGSAYSIAVTATGIKPGNISEGAAILTDSKTVPAVPLMLRLQVTGDVACLPATASAPQMADGTPEPFETIVKRYTPGELVIEGVTESNKLPLEFKVERLDASSCRLKVKLQGQFKRFAPFGNLLIRTNVEEQPVQLYYYVIVRNPSAATGSAK